MIFSWLRKRRRQKLLAEPFSADWRHYLEINVPHYAMLDEAEQAKLRDDLRIFIAEKEWEGCRGLEMTDEVKVTVGAFACLLALGMKDEYFDRVMTILVYPGAYVAPEQPTPEGLLVEDSEREGEAHYRGPVILNWSNLLAEAHAPELGRNLVFHEFAHQLDMVNGEADGVPVLADAESYARWKRVMAKEFRRLVRAVERGEPTFLDPYAAEHESELFSVATEYFFNLPRQLRQQHPALYDAFVGFYRQDPATWPLPWGG